MGKKHKPIEFWLCTNNSQPQGQTYIRPTADFLNSEPFCKLTYQAQILYLRMAAAAKGNEVFIYPLSFYKGRMSKAGFYKARNELIKSGFIKIVTNGRATRTCDGYKFVGKWKENLNSPQIT